MQSREPLEYVLIILVHVVKVEKVLFYVILLIDEQAIKAEINYNETYIPV